MFENLNKGGKKLSKYQVFAAQWSKHELRLSNEPINRRILEITIQRYEDLIESRNVEINNFSKEDMLEDKTINVAEYCYALGKLILEKMFVFWDHDNEDTANKIGYSTLAMVFRIRNKDMSKLVNFFNTLDNAEFIEVITTAILNIYRDINSIFEKHLKVPGASKALYSIQGTSDFQLMSFFGSLWITKHSDLQSGKLEIKQKYKPNYKQIELNLLHYYIYDRLTGRWSGTGDSKLDRIVIDKENSYIKDLDSFKIESALLNWHEDALEKSSINFDPISKLLYTVLCSYYNPYFNEKTYDNEHIIPRKQLSEIKKRSNQNIPGGSIGNFMYLDSTNNRSKQEFSLYDVIKPGYSLEQEMLTIQAYPTKTEFSEIKFEVQRNNGEYNQLISTISSRGKALITDLVNKLYENRI
ncbi:hypothetical protein [Fundicoccus ignavus]|uniref:DUF1524 domain-containing protein n=1 Tax=Fundicoccus ignavus TaxID=2664442 RepID=A0A844BYW5_9LACT|nr:hypothetical protein [Fundicoccus ignavus]MRJ47209.1 hypothetical protein [Fundicoccus ignavus]